MLVLSRKQNQEIMIGDDIKVTILKVKGNTVRIGIEAPQDVRVLRGELPVKETAGRKMANVTVVFDNSHDKDEENIRIVSFPGSQNPNESRSESDPKVASPSAPPKDSVPTVRFRQQLPMNLHRNRLQEIVDELTTQKK